MRIASWTLCALTLVGPVGCNAENKTVFDTSPEVSETPETTLKHGWWGKPGPTGPAGPAGPVGPQGEVGPQGVVGAQGSEGSIGAQGEVGLQGAVGSQGVVGPVGPQGVVGAQGTTGLQGPEGLEGIAGPPGPPGLMEHLSVDLSEDYGFIGMALSNLYLDTSAAEGQDANATAEPAELARFLEEGTYLLTWYAEVMRVSSGGHTVFARLRDRTLGETVGSLRLGGSAAWNGSESAMPTDSTPFATGSIIPFSGSKVLVLPEGEHSFSLEYGMPFNDRGGVAMRVRRQRLTLLRLD